MDKLGIVVYADKKLLYDYKGTEVPCLQMVDDILTFTKCDPTAVAINSTVNTFIETKKLKLAEKKCSVIHVGKKCGDCPQLRVHDKKMHKASSLKYLGDTIYKSGKNFINIIERRAKAYAIFAEIRAILENVPLGKYRTKIGLQLRQAMFVNGVLFNTEVWHGLKQADLDMLSIVDHKILRYIIQAHAKTHNEFLYLETGAIPLPFIVSSRRMIYLQNILKTEPKELVRRVFEAPKSNPTKGDFINLVLEDFELTKLPYNENVISEMGHSEYKTYIKKHNKSAALSHLKTISSHSKVEKS